MNETGLEQPSSKVRWRRALVQERPASYAVAGEGPPLVFLHGWALSHRTYRQVHRQLVGRGLTVLAPTMPGFSGTAPLPREDFSLEGYARWVDAFLDEVGVTEPVTLVGHSFGGGVAIKTAHDWPDRIARLVLVNSIGGSVWGRRGDEVRTMRERPLWDWGLHLQSDTLSLRSITRVVPVIAADAVPNAVRRPHTLWHVGGLARNADLAAELEELKRRRLPVVILWGRQDKVIPMACADSLAVALGDLEVVTVDGNHSWLLSDPSRFAEVITNVTGLAPPDALEVESGDVA